MQSKKIIQAIEKTAPLKFSESWDLSGIQVASENKEIQRMAVALDPTPKTVSWALEKETDFLLCHHPLTLKPSLPSRVDYYHYVLKNLLGRKIWLYSAHTSLDVNGEGPASWLADHLGLTNRKVVYPSCVLHPLRIEFSPPLPWNILEEIKKELSVLDQRTDSAGVTHITIREDYKPLFQTYMNNHLPQNQYASFVLEETTKKMGFGLFGSLNRPMGLDSFLELVCGRMDLANSRFIGTPPEQIKKVAYCPGSGADFAPRAFGLGADVYITGDIKFHQAQEIEEIGFALDAGHFILEEEMMRTWCAELQNELPELDIFFIEGKDPFFARLY